MNDCVHLDLDGAWPADALPIPTVNFRRFGPPLRYITREQDVRAFSRALPAQPSRFFLYGSGDFHHLSGALVRRAADEVNRPVRVVSFDNHPDWDMRPPRWGCGGWVNRALEYDRIDRVSVWGCGNFEMNWPHRLFRNRAALREKRLEVFPWTERQSPAVAQRFPGVSRQTWKSRFEKFADEQSGMSIYVTVDMDCLCESDAVTDWEAGLFAAEDIAWAIRTLRARAKLIAGDVCGATSPARYARSFQRFAGWWDHPTPKTQSPADATAVNVRSLRTIWPAMTGEGQHG